MRVAVRLLAGGLACIAAGAALAHFVMIGLFGLGLAAAGFGLVIAGATTVRSRFVSRPRAACGFVVLLAGAGALFVVTFLATGLALDEVLYTRTRLGEPPPLSGWAVIGLLALVPAAGPAAGLRLRAGWSPGRCLTWALGTLSTIPVALAVFLGLADFLPLEACAGVLP